MLAPRFLAAVLLSALTAGPVAALSCMPYAPQQAFQDASTSPDPYVIVHGKLSFNPADLPKGFDERGGGPTEETLFTASMVGFSLTAAGFNNRFIRNIKVHAACAGPWCATLETGEDYLLFLKKVGQNYLLEITPCPGFSFLNPSAEVLNDIHQCLLGEACTPPQF
ncbi:MAG TPA: hypothetical protein ENK28_04985 [Aliiroseovarius sp.]|nr:hypothetical protein [Aliiroseovarius sp.]